MFTPRQTVDSKYSYQSFADDGLTSPFHSTSRNSFLRGNFQDPLSQRFGASDGLGSSYQNSAALEPGVFRVGTDGTVKVDFLFDSGAHHGEVAIFSLEGMDCFQTGSVAYIREAASRALSNSKQGHVVISDWREGAKFTGALGEGNFNDGPYLGAKTIEMRPGDTVGFMLVSNGTVEALLQHGMQGGSQTPFFSIASANPKRTTQLTQVVEGVFSWEDIWLGSKSDRDYNDIIFSVHGLAGTAAPFGESVSKRKDWRNLKLGQDIINSVLCPEPEPDQMSPAIVAALFNDTAPGGTTNTDKITADPTITGTLTDASQIVEFRAGFGNTPESSYFNLLASRKEDGRFTLDRAQLEQVYGGILQDGTYTLHLRARDQYSNASGVDITFTLDTTTRIPTADLLASSDTGLSDSDYVTRDSTPTIAGTAEAGAIVQLFSNNTLINQTTASLGNWEFTTAPLTNGIYTVKAIATDSAGNKSLPSAPLAITIDTALPQLVLSTPVESNPLTLQSRLTGSANGTGSAVAAMSYRFNNLNEIPILFDTNGSFDQLLNLTGLSNGNHTLTITLADQAGNSTTVQYAVTVNVVLDEGLTLREGQAFEVDLNRSLTTLQQPSILSFTFDARFDLTDLDSMKDAFEVGLVDETGESLVHSIELKRDSFFNLSEGQATALGAGTRLSQQTVSLDLPVLPAGKNAKLIFRLVNNDQDTGTVVTIRDLQVLKGSQGTNSATPLIAQTNETAAIDFSHLTDISPSLTIQYGRTSFNAASQVLYSNVSIQNQGTYSVKGPLLVVVKNLSDPRIQVLDADGLTPEGLPYYDFSYLLTNKTLASGQTSLTRSLAFSNPAGIQFTYDLEFLGQLNHSPVIASNPIIETLVGKPYNYTIEATDPDQDTLNYSLLLGPQGMGVNSNTGQVIWAPTAANIGNHSVVLQVQDAYGAIARQAFTLTVANNVPNRPPIFTSTPVVDAWINQRYTYDANATDPDQDSLSYSLILGPEGMRVNPNTGVVEWTPPPVLSLGDSVLGRISLPGENSEFAFSGVLGQRLYIDFLQYTGLPQSWGFEVYSPSGQGVTSSDFNTNQNSRLFTLTETGNYRLVVDPRGEQTGSYAFSVIDPNLLTTTSFDTVIEGQLNPGTEDDLFRFRGYAGQKLFFDKLSNNGELDWVLYDPGNGVVASESNMNDMELSLPTDGEYILALRGRAGFTNTVNYAFEVVTPDETTIPLTLGSNAIPNSVSTTISEPGEEDFYTFAGTKGQRIYLDRLNPIDNRSINFTLYTPSGQDIWSYIDQRGALIRPNFESGHEWGPITLQEDGIYRIRIDAAGDVTGPYSFNLRDLGLATSIQLDTGYSGVLESGESSHLYRFTAPAGQRLFIDYQDNSGADRTKWVLYDSGNNPVAAKFTGEYIEVVLNQTDTYTLIIEGDKETIPVNYSFQIITPDTILTPLNFNTPVLDQIRERGEQDVFTFTGVQGQRVSLDILNSSFNNTAQLISPSGTNILTYFPTLSPGEIWWFNSAPIAPITLPESGTYRLLFDGQDGTTDSYGFQLIDVSAAPVLPADTLISGTLNPGKSIQYYQFTGNEGDRLYLDSQTTASDAVWQLYGASNQEILTALDLRQDRELVLPGDGNYFLMIRGESTKPISYAIQRLVTPATPVPLIDATQALSFGEAASGLASAGQTNTYSFTGTANQRLIFDSLSRAFDRDSLSAKIYSPTGQLVSRYNFWDDDPGAFTLQENGTYRVVIDATGENTGSYSFRLLNFANATAIDLDTVFSSNLGLSGQETQLYRFTGEQNQRIYIDRLEGHQDNRYALYAPDGQQLLSHFSGNGTRLPYQRLDWDYNPALLPSTGEYILAVIGNGGSNPNYSLNLITPDFTTAPYTIGEAVSGRINEKGEQDTYTFTGTAGQQLFYDALGGDSLGVSLYDPAGRAIYSVLAGYSVVTDNRNDRGPDSGLTLAVNGTYRLVIDGAGEGTGNYQFRLLDRAKAPVVALDSNITGTFDNNALSSNAYRFNLTNKQFLYVDAQAGDGSWSVYGPGGQLIDSNRLWVDRELDLNAGEYLLVTQGYGSNPNYGLRLVTSELTTLPIQLGQAISGTLSEAGERDTYTFTGRVGQQLFYDALGGDRFGITLQDPTGRVVYPGLYQYGIATDSRDDRGPDAGLTLTVDGTYRLTFDGVGDSTGNYQFRLLDKATAPIIPFNTDIAGTPDNNGLGSVAYRFNLADRQYLYFDGQTDNATWKIFGPSGQLVNSAYFVFGDREFWLDSGDYLLVLQGWGGNSNFQFQLAAPQLENATLPLGNLVNGSITTRGEQDTYTFTGTVGQRLFFDAIAGNLNLKARLYGPGDVLLRDRDTANDWEPLTLTANGSYRLVIDGVNTTTGNYGFILNDLSQAIPLSFSTSITGSLAPGNSVDLYRFNGTQGTALSFDLAATQWSEANWVLYDSGNRAIATPASNSPDFQVILPSNGQYTLAMIGSSEESINYGFQVNNTTAPAVRNRGFNTVRSGVIASGGQVDRYSFTTNAGTMAFFDSQGNASASLLFRVLNPDGSIAINNALMPSDRGPEDFKLNQTGQYTLEVYGTNGTGTGNYQFQLLELSDNTSSSQNSLNTGNIFKGTLAPRAAIAYSFDGSVGQQIYLNGIDGNNVTARLYAPNGTEVVAVSNIGTQDRGPYVVTQEGMYHLVLQGEQDSTESYEVQLLNFDAGSDLQFNLSNTGALSSGLQEELYKFTGKTGQTLFFDSRVSDSNRWKLYSPGNVLLQDQELRNDFEVALTQDGVYTLMIGGSSESQLNYDFRVFAHDKERFLDTIIPGTGERSSTDNTSLGSFAVRLQVEDGRGGSGFQDYQIRLLPDPENHSPVITSTPETTIGLNQGVYAYQIESFDLDNDELTYSLLDTPSGSFIQKDTGKLLWLPERTLTVGEVYSFTVEVNDRRGGSTQQTFTVKAEDNNVRKGFGEIRGTIWQDDNSDRQRGATESGAAGVKVYLDLNANGKIDPGEPVELTAIDNPFTLGVNETGQYKFTDLVPGTYIVREVVPTGFIQTSPVEPLRVRNDGVTVGGSLSLLQPNPNLAATFIGRAGISTDGFGGNDESVGVVQAEIPAGSTIESAFLHVASRSFGNPSDPKTVFRPNAVGFEGAPVSLTWLDKVQDLPRMSFETGRADVTSIVASKVGREGGLFNFAVDEYLALQPSNAAIEGISLTVIYSNPNLPERTIVVLEGGLTGEAPQTNVLLWDNALNTTSPDFAAQMALGIQYSWQAPFGTATQFSTVDINGKRLTSTAGGSEDGVIAFDPFTSVSGALFTVGGVGDSPANPNPFDTRSLSDDELYNLAPFIRNGDTALQIDTANPSNDDSIFLVALTLPGVPRLDSSGFFSVNVAPGEVVENVNFGNGRTAAQVQNTPPTFTSRPPTIITVGNQLRYEAAATDTLPTDDWLSYDLVVKPEGMAIDAKTGVVFWSPTSAQVGTVDVVLRVQDLYGGKDLQYFKLEVKPPNSAPAFTSIPPSNALPQIGKPFEYQTIAIDADGDPVTYQLVNAVPNGVAINATTGLLTWTPNAGQLGNQAIVIQATDGLGGETLQTLNLSVIAARPNTTPDITSNPRLVTRVDTPYLYRVAVTDIDSDPLRFSLMEAPEGMAIDAQGQLGWRPTAAQIGTHTVTIAVNDGQGGSDTQSYSLSVRHQAENDAPTITSQPILLTNLGRNYQYQATATDPDGDVLFWELTQAPDSMVIDARTGAISWQPIANQVGDQTVSVSAIDTLGAFATQTFTLQVRSVNTPPQIFSAPLTQIGINQPYTYGVQARDPENDRLSFSLASRPEGMAIDARTGQILWTPTATQLGSYEVEVLVNDTQGGTGRQRYTLLVSSLPINQAPSITSTPGFWADTVSGYRYQLAATDPEGDSLTYALLAGPTGATVDGTTGLLQWQPTAVQLGQQTITVAAFDRQGLGGTQQYTLTVTERNQAPLIRSTPKLTTLADTPYRYDVRASDPDGEPITIALTQAPTGMAIDSLGRISWVPGTAAIGTYPIGIQVTDSRGAVTTQLYNLVVQADTIAPRVSLSVSDPQVTVGSNVTVRVSATDNVGVDTLRLSLNGTPISFDAQGLATVRLAATGLSNLLATATDAAGNVGSATAQVLSIDPTDRNAPVVDLTSFVGGQPFTTLVKAPTGLLGTVTDDNLLYYTLAIAPVAGGNFTEIFRGTNTVNQSILGTFDPSILQNDSYILRLSATDAGGLTAYDETLVNVAGDLKIGNFQLSFTDLSIPVAGIPIQVTRTYDTLTANTTDEFGYGWRLEFRDTDLRTSLGRDAELEELGVPSKGFAEGDRVYITLPGGQREAFTFKPQARGISRYFPALGGGDSTLYTPAFQSDAGVTSTLTVEDVTLMRSETGEFVSLNGGKYNPAAELYGFGGYYKLTTKEGVVYRINTTTGDLETVSDRNGNSLTFTDAAITSSTGQQVTFERDARGRITAVIDPSGKRVNYTYDPLGDLVAVTDRTGSVTRFDYNDSRLHYLDEVIDPLGRSGVRTEYDAAGRLVKMIDAAGNPVQLIHDPNNFIEQVRDQLGNITTYEYDQRGNVLTKINPLGGVTRRSYDADNNTLTETDSLGNTTRFSYDSSGNVLTETDPLGNVTRYTYDRFGNVLTTTDPTGQTTANVYDARGNLTQITGQASGPLTFSYDAFGNLAGMQDGSGATTFEYDARGNITRQTDALGHVTAYTYDVNGNRLTETTTQTTFTGVRTLVTRMVYDAQGRVIQTTNAEGGVTRTVYDAAGNRVETIDALGRSTKYVYDERGQLIQTIYPDSTPNDATDNSRVRTEYDAAGRVIAEIDELGRRTQFVYDALGRKVTTIYSDATPTIDTDNPRTRTEYDAAGRVLAEIDERGNRTEFRYDAAGRLTETIYPDATPNDLTDNPRTKSTYDAAGRQLTQIDALEHVTRSLYDDLGRPVGQEYADGTRTSVTFDAAGRVVGRTDQAGKTTRYEYDALGRLTAVIDALGQRTAYTYDEQGSLMSQRDANGHVTRYEYDGLGRRIATALPLGQRSSMLYDALGNMVSTTDFNGDTITYAYNPRNWLTAKDLPGTEFDVTYTYTLDGQRQTVTDSRGITTYAYDARNQLLQRVDPDGRRIGYTYDLAGNRTSVVIPSGTTTYTFDAQNRLSTVTDPTSGVTSYTYDLVGNLIRTTLPNNTVETRQYNDLNRLLYLENSGPNGIINSFRYTLDPTGNRTAVQEQDGRRVAYTYDNLYRLTQEAITDAGATNPTRTIGYVYDPVGNRLTRNDSTEGTTTYAYDINDRLLNATTNGIATTYTYDNNGNTRGKTTGSNTVTYQWNAENRLISADTNGDGIIDVVNRYNEDGIRVSQTANGQETRFLIDANLPYAQVLEEYTPGGNINVSYVYGNDLISQNRGGERSFYHVDGLGSTRALSDNNGLETNNYIYDAFGQIIQPLGAAKILYLFAGEQRDVNLGLDYLRARYFDSDTGRLYGRDPFDGFLKSPLSIHDYQYGYSNPVNFVDPSGKVGESIFTIIGKVIHEGIGWHFISEGEVKGHDRDFDITIDQLADEAGLTTNFSSDRRPDLIDYTARQIYEIKPKDQASRGYQQLREYLGTINDNDEKIKWNVGKRSNYIAPSLSMNLGIANAKLKIETGNDGLILYSFEGNLRKVNVNSEVYKLAFNGLLITAFASFQAARLNAELGNRIALAMLAGGLV